MSLSDIITVASAALWLPLAAVVGFIAHKRGRFGYGWFLLGVLTTPVITGPLVLLLPRVSSALVAGSASPPSPASSPSPSAVAPTETAASPNLRLAFLAVATAMFVLWIWSLQPIIQNWNNPNEDGFSMVPAFWGTIACLPVGLYLLAGAVLAQPRHVARARNALYVALGVLAICAAFLIFQHFANAD